MAKNLSSHQAMAAPARISTLPVRQHKDRIVDKVKLNRVTLIVADTGTGKSSQVPQMLLEEGLAPILCTQPRRLAVVAISKLLAHERGCLLGDEVGYHIGQKKVVTSRSRLVLQTAGVLLEELRSKGAMALSMYKVLILDEVHERSIESDLVLTCIKQLMLRNGNIRLVLMSATADSIRYKDYFKDIDRGERVEIIPILNTPTQLQFVSFQCKVYYLEEVIRLLDKKKEYLSYFNCEQNDLPYEKGNLMGDTVHDLITDLVFYLHKCEVDVSKSILIFLPTYKALEQQWSLLKRMGVCLKLYVLHSSVDIEDSMRAMESSPSDRKVILATNVAESSVTVPGISYVIDSCWSLEIYWDNTRNREMPRLVWVSKSQADQRKGRTGRTCDGEVFRLVPKRKYHDFANFETPAMQLLSLRRQVLMLSCAESKAINDPSAVLSRAMDPPIQLTVESALKALVSIGALRAPSNQRGKYIPTTYGKLLVGLPVSLEAAILVVKGGQKGMLREAAVVAALIDASPCPIVPIFGERKQYQMHLEKYLTEASSLDYASVILANLNAFEFWQRTLKDKQRLEKLVRHANTSKEVGSEAFVFSLQNAEQEWCVHHHLSQSALHGIAETCAIVIENIHRYRPKFLSQSQGPPAYYSVYDFKHACNLSPKDEEMTGNIFQEDGPNEEVVLCYRDQFVMSGQFHSFEDTQQLRTLIHKRNLQHSIKYIEHEEGTSPDSSHLCRFFQRWDFSKGDTCVFSHDLLKNSSLCRYFMSPRGCRYGDNCQFLHSGIDPVSAIGEDPLEFEEDSPMADLFLKLLPSCNEENACEELILIYGDEDFTFTESLSQHYQPTKILVMSKDLMTDAMEMGSASLADRIFQLSSCGVKIVWGVDATARAPGLQSVISWSKIKCVLWAIRGGNDEAYDNQKMWNFFSFLSITLLSECLMDITVVLTMYNTQYSKWQVERVARDCFYFLSNSLPFDVTTFGYYKPSEVKGFVFGEAKPVTYVFELQPPSEVLHGDYFFCFEQALRG